MTVENTIEDFSWDSAMEDLEKFNALYRDLKRYHQSTKSPYDFIDNFDSIRDHVTALRDSADPVKNFKNVANPTGESVEFALDYWLIKNFGKPAYYALQVEIDAAADRAKVVLEFYKRKKKTLDVYRRSEHAGVKVPQHQREEWKEETTELREIFLRCLTYLDLYIQILNKYIGQTYSDSAIFTYEGFRIYNPSRIAKPLAIQMLGGIDYLKSIFRDRRLLPLFETGIKSFKLDLSEWNSRLHGTYNIKTQQITLYSNMVQGAPNLLDSWIKQIFIHEFGHYIHATYITGEARRFWDSWWDVVKEAYHIEEKLKPILRGDRVIFWKALKHKKYDIQKALHSIPDKVDRMRFMVWLNNPSKGDKNKIITSYDLGSTPRLTQYGKDMFSFFKDPKVSGSEREELEEEYLYILNVDTYAKKEWPEIPPDIQKKIRGTYPSGAQAILDLGAPSNYARTNEFEDFAESFVLFFVAPRRLSPLAQYRMKRTLSLSGLYGKPVMTFAKVVEALVDQDMADEARELLVTKLLEMSDGR